MSIGVETFETLWDGNENYLFSILVTSEFDSAGFSWIPLIIFDPPGNSAAPIGTIPAGVFTSKLAVTVTVPLGVSVSSVLVSMLYRDQTSTLQGCNVTFPAGSPLNTCRIPILVNGTSISSVTNISSLPNPTGTLLVETPLYIAESFLQTEWPSATPGL